MHRGSYSLGDDDGVLRRWHAALEEEDEEHEAVEGDEAAVCVGCECVWLDVALGTLLHR